MATIMPLWPLLDVDEKAAVTTEVVRSVTRAIATAPFHIRLAVKSVSMIIGLCIVLISAGAGDPLARTFRVDRFYGLLQKMPGPTGSVIRLYRSMTLLAFYEQAPVAAKLLAAQPAHNSKV
ncbi:hypothetical protein [Ensifer sp. LCM 4579]|uniref:hypothetical protein n=1 Tax=Ensifer sp. LCM 4579 TaxID=1848292 RepID=UPI001FCDC04F|nr:hypothetical protein [Ensifer sp. LCM 4579]